VANRAPSTPLPREACTTDGRQCNAVFGALARGIWWGYPHLWLVPLLTWMVITPHLKQYGTLARIEARDEES
jgi:hypothetical protein